MPWLQHTWQPHPETQNVLLTTVGHTRYGTCTELIKPRVPCCEQVSCDEQARHWVSCDQRIQGGCKVRSGAVRARHFAIGSDLPSHADSPSGSWSTAQPASHAQPTSHTHAAVPITRYCDIPQDPRLQCRCILYTSGMALFHHCLHGCRRLVRVHRRSTGHVPVEELRRKDSWLHTSYAVITKMLLNRGSTTTWKFTGSWNFLANP